jgi:hypothetical protein
MIQLDLGHYDVGACISTVHSRTWLNTYYAELAEIEKDGKPLVGKPKLVTAFPWSKERPARVYKTDKLRVLGNSVPCEVLVSEALPESAPPILGVDFLNELSDITLCPSEESVFILGDTLNFKFDIV